jgi:hypothetical protein
VLRKEGVWAIPEEERQSRIEEVFRKAKSLPSPVPKATSSSPFLGPWLPPGPLHLLLRRLQLLLGWLSDLMK